jgi:hypothetical protein
MAIWNIIWTFEIIFDHLVHFVFIWCTFSGFGIMYQEKSGNPDAGDGKKMLPGLANRVTKLGDFWPL